MKKIISVLLVALMLVGVVLSAVSCGKKDDTLVCGVTIVQGRNREHSPRAV